MNWDSEEDKKIRRYLLGDLSAEMTQQVEENLLRDDDYAELLLMIEDELIDDYARGLLSEQERQPFNRSFSLTPQRLQKLIIAQELVKYAKNSSLESDDPNFVAVAEEQEQIKDGIAQQPQLYESSRTVQSSAHGWRQTWFWPAWKIAAYAVLVVGLGLGIWRMRSTESEIDAASKAMNQVYRNQRPIEARISGFDYASFPKTLGNSQEQFDYVALDRAERVLLDGLVRHPTVETQHALGRLYLARKKFDQAEKQLRLALQTDANNARLHNDLGVALFEKWDQERSAGQTPENEELKRQSLEHLRQAVTLDGSLYEARFNLALLYQASGQIQLAREEWKKYLAGEPDSRWAKEAQHNLELLK